MNSRMILSTITLTTSALAQAPVYDVSGQTNDEFGRSVAGVGDIDLDGIDDFAVGAPFGDGLQPDAGYVRVFSGRTGAALFSFLGEHTGDRMGYSVAGLGDVDGDGVSDLIVGAPFFDKSSAANCGKIYVVSGGTAQALRTHEGFQVDAWWGWSVASPGDVTGDGVPDYGMGAPGANVDFGIVETFSGASGTLHEFYVGEDAGDMLGTSLAGTGDLTGDGIPDLVAGAPYFDTGFALPAGRAYLLDGSSTSTANKTLIATGVSGGHLGHDVTSGFDFDADGVLDIALGEPFRMVAGFPAGRVRIVSGATLAIVHTLNGTGDDEMGYSIAGLADADGDGHGDLMVGLPGGDVGGSLDLGLVQVFSGASWQLLYQWNGYHLDERMGYSVASAGTVNNDPWTDMLAGAPWSDLNFVNGGRVRLVLGSAPVPTSYCAAKTNSSGCVPFIGFTGCASTSISDGFHLRGLNVLQGPPGILIWSLAPSSIPFQGGTLCVAPPVRRTTAQAAAPQSGYPCTGAYDFHFSHDYMEQWGLDAGTDVFAQYWSRDNGFAPPQNIGLTDALQFTLLP